MDQELRQYLDAKFSQVDAKFSQMDAKFATKQDLERVETALLTEFHKWASPMEQRMRTHREALRALDLETARLDERITKLEPPPQQH